MELIGFFQYQIAMKRHLTFKRSESGEDLTIKLSKYTGLIQTTNPNFHILQYIANKSTRSDTLT